jgi:hypothetical protein
MAFKGLTSHPLKAMGSQAFEEKDRKQELASFTHQVKYILATPAPQIGCKHGRGNYAGNSTVDSQQLISSWRTPRKWHASNGVVSALKLAPPSQISPIDMRPAPMRFTMCLLQRLAREQ